MSIKARDREAGLTIVELMIALLIGSILVAGLISLFLSVRQTQNTREHLDNVANDARFFTSFIAHDIRMAGYQNAGCQLSAAGLAWDNSSRVLTVRYCKPGQTSPDTFQYTFSGDGAINYLDEGVSSTSQPLLDGVTLDSIWFGQQTANGLIYDKNSAPDFGQLRTVRLVFTVSGQSGSGLKGVKPLFDFTIGVRNNTLEPLTGNGSGSTGGA